jgi:hypothetical protein
MKTKFAIVILAVSMLLVKSMDAWTSTYIFHMMLKTCKILYLKVSQIQKRI